MQIEISRYVFDNFEIGDEIKQKMQAIESSKMSYGEFKKYDLTKKSFMQSRFDSNLSENQKTTIINKHIHETLTSFDEILKSNNNISSFFEFMANLSNFKDNPTAEKAELIKGNIEALKSIDLTPEQKEFVSQVEQVYLNETQEQNSEDIKKTRL
ncbi:hypothetical protein LMG7974_01580 [Campylobacter majalis]|uniref:Uncharacterized protein n=1 Tax=Campylobacter majalis TaxID=2790656 RepID=A0ABN7KAE9_9BACT|nr:hypothetical protein [Campylobacter majalis]CAD7289503.1 hypothetical protein LMG7974_01580 [Campylobacter majalis]